MRHVAMVDAGMVPAPASDRSFAAAGVTRSGTDAAGAEVTGCGDALPGNRGGELTAEWPPSGAGGVTQCVERLAQLRGDAIDQVDGARVTLAHNVGGPTVVVAATILEGPGKHGR